MVPTFVEELVGEESLREGSEAGDFDEPRDVHRDERREALVRFSALGVRGR